MLGRRAAEMGLSATTRPLLRQDHRASSTPLQEGFLQRNLTTIAPSYRSQFNHLAEVQASLRKGDTKNADKLLASDRQQNNMVSEACYA